MTYELELRWITKRFPGVLANDGVDLAVRSGDIHAIVGENGAGKSTLMSILYGLYSPDDGEIVIRGSTVKFHSPIDAMAAGLGMVHQAFKLFPSLTVAENVIYGAEPTSRDVFIDQKSARARVTDLSRQHGLAVDPDVRIEDLPVGILQRVEILKALYRGARIIILDEPTAVLTPQERDRLFEVLQQLQGSGHTILLITHKLGEVLAVSDHVTVLRNGRSVAHLVTADTDEFEISRHMIGRDARLNIPKREAPMGDVVLSACDVSVTGEHELHSVRNLSLEVRAGEILGIAGVSGNGQRELIDAITGMGPIDSGTILLCDEDITHRSIAVRRQKGMAYIPEDRHGVGSAGAASVADNLLMGVQRQHAFQRRGWMQRPAIRRLASRLVEEYDIKVSSPETSVATLSGGSLQKVVVAREMHHQARLLVAEQPTRGIDIGAIGFIHRRVTEFRDTGGAVLLVSAELRELLTIADRILVMFEGRVVAERTPRETTEVELGLYMAGGGARSALAGASDG